MGKFRVAALLLAAALTGAALTSCDDGRQTAAKQAAGELAAALSALDVSHAPLKGTEPAAAQESAREAGLRYLTWPGRPPVQQTRPQPERPRRPTPPPSCSGL